MAISARFLELERLEVHAVALEVDDADARDGDPGHPLDEAVSLHLAVRQELEAEEVAIERERSVGVGARDREVVDAGDHAPGR